MLFQKQQGKLVWLGFRKGKEMESFVDSLTAESIINKYGSPVYVYNEKILRERCRDLIGAFRGKILPSYSVKANNNISLLKIIKEEGLRADAMSPGEIFLLEQAGFISEEIFYISNNVTQEEMQYAIDKGILISVDSLSQLELYGQINRGGRVAVRFNPGIGAGHSKKVITAGEGTKFGVQAEFWAEVKAIIKKHHLDLVGVNQHIGSLFLEPTLYIQAAENLLNLVREHFPGLNFIDFGGGFGVPYKATESRFDFDEFSKLFLPILDKFIETYDNKCVQFKCESGRYIVAECCSILGRVTALKDNYGQNYVGTDIGFNVIMRPLLYDSYHEIKIHSVGKGVVNLEGPVHVVGNICESGDILAHNRDIGPVKIGDIIEVMTAGAYVYSMASNYNCRLRPPEILIREDGSIVKIRERDTLEGLLQNFSVC